MEMVLRPTPWRSQETADASLLWADTTHGCWSWRGTRRLHLRLPQQQLLAEVLRSLLSHATSLVGRNLALIRKMFRLLACRVSDF
ncbi:hypothetical protein ACQJBY_006404 [Aegilops geniculata]